MADMTLTSVKDFIYRDVREEFTNRYCFTGDGVATTQSEFESLAAAFIEAEREVVGSGVRFKRCIGYDHFPVVTGDTFNWAYDPSVGGTVNYPTGNLAETGGSQAPGDAAAFVRILTDTPLSNGKPRYLIHYYHGAWAEADDPDELLAAQKAALIGFGESLMASGFYPDVTVCSPTGHEGVSAGAGQWLTTRTLKRRGKRVPT